KRVNIGDLVVNDGTSVQHRIDPLRWVRKIPLAAVKAGSLVDHECFESGFRNHWEIDTVDFGIRGICSLSQKDGLTTIRIAGPHVERQHSNEVLKVQNMSI